MPWQYRESNGNGLAMLWQWGNSNLWGVLLDENHHDAVAAVQQPFPGCKGGIFLPKTTNSKQQLTSDSCMIEVAHWQQC